MHAAVLVAAAIAVIGAIGVLVWLPARARTHPDDIDLVAHDPAAIAVAVARAPRNPRTSSPRHRRPEADSLRRSSGSRSVNQSSIVLRE